MSTVPLLVKQDSDVVFVTEAYTDAFNESIYLGKLHQEFYRYDSVHRLRPNLTFGSFIRHQMRKSENRHVPAKVRRAVILRDNYTCQLCGKYMPDGKDLQIDHILPVSKGGQSIAYNLQVLCSKCNMKKGTDSLYFDYYGKMLSDYYSGNLSKYGYSPLICEVAE